MLACDFTRVTSILWRVFFNIHESGVLITVTWLVPRETAAASACSVHTIQSCTMSFHAKPHIIYM